MIVRWMPEAEEDRAAILDYIGDQGSAAAVRMDRLFGDCAAQLADFPMLGHVGEIADTRELTAHRSYRLVYDIAGDTVRILALVHSAWRWPPEKE